GRSWPSTARWRRWCWQWRSGRGELWPGGTDAASQGPEKIHDLLLFGWAQPVESADRTVGFACVLPNCYQQVRRSAVVQKEHALSDAPEWRGPEVVGSGAALHDAVGQLGAHVM